MACTSFGHEPGPPSARFRTGTMKRDTPLEAAILLREHADDDARAVEGHGAEAPHQLAIGEGDALSIV